MYEQRRVAVATLFFGNEVNKMVQIQNLSLQQLKFSLAGIKGSDDWNAMEKQMPIDQQGECIEALARVKEPERVIQRMIIAKRMNMIRKHK